MENIIENTNWTETKIKLRLRFTLLTETDLLLADGKQAEMLGRLQLKLGKTKEEIFELVSELLKPAYCELKV